MPGFANARVMADAQDAGRYLYASFRKQATQTTGAGIWFDLSMSPGNPAPNYYIGTPGVFTPMRQSTDGGLRHGGNVSPSKKFLRKLLVETATAAAAPCQLLLLDYVGFYGFIDESVLDPQPLDNTTPLPRYADGRGVQMMPVETAQEMLNACEGEMPADIAIFTAAVADWRVTANWVASSCARHSASVLAIG